MSFFFVLLHYESGSFGRLTHKKRRNMLVFNTTYRVLNADARNFVIWVHQRFIPAATEDGVLVNARLTRILTHNEEESECFALQFDVEDSTVLHRWYTRVGDGLRKEMQKMFDERVTEFSTLMEIITGE
jgi:hypothetical protein